MSWEKCAYTTVGLAALQSAIYGGALTITRAVSGTEKTAGELEALTDVCGDRQELQLLGLEETVVDGKEARQITLRIIGADASRIIHQIGVFGRTATDSEEILLFVLQDDRGIEVPALEESANFEITLRVLLRISNNADLSVTVDAQYKTFLDAIERQIGIHDADPLAHSAILSELSALKREIDLLNLKISTDVTDNLFEITFGTLDGYAVAGVWNEPLQRIEF